MHCFKIKRCSCSWPGKWWRCWLRCVLVPAAAVLAGTAGAQTLVDLGATAPTPGTNDISQLSTLGNRTDPDGLNYYTDDQTSFGTGEPGQTFLTGTNPAGYVLSSLAIRTAGLGSDSGIGTAQPYYLHLYSVSGSTVTPLQTNTSANITFNDGDWLQWTGLSLILSPNTAYAWSFGKASSTNSWEAMAVATNLPYAAGQIGLFPPGGGTVTFGSSHSFDAVFDVGLSLKTPSGYLPPGWSDADIGSPGLAGSAGYTNGLWTVTGGGSDIWNTADQFNFCSTNFSGNGTMITLVTSLQNSDPGSGWSKAGIMFRNDYTAGSANVSIVATAGQGISFQWRSTAGGSSSNGQHSGITTPVWLELVCSNGTYTGSYSMNGSTWVQVGSQIGCVEQHRPGRIRCDRSQQLGAEYRHVHKLQPDQYSQRSLRSHAGGFPLEHYFPRLNRYHRVIGDRKPAHIVSMADRRRQRRHTDEHSRSDQSVFDLHAALDRHVPIRFGGHEQFRR